VDTHAIRNFIRNEHERDFSLQGENIGKKFLTDSGCKSHILAPNEVNIGIVKSTSWRGRTNEKWWCLLGDN